MGGWGREHLGEFGPFGLGVMGQGVEGGEFVVGEGAAELGAFGDGLEDVVDTDAEFDDMGGDAELVVDAPDFFAKAGDAGADLVGVVGGEGDLLAIEFNGLGVDAVGEMAEGVGRDADDGAEAEVGFAEFVDAANEGFGGDAGDAGVLDAELFPGEPERFIGAGLVDLAEGYGLGVSTLSGDHGESLLAAGNSAGLEDCVIFHRRKTLTVARKNLLETKELPEADRKTLTAGSVA